MAVATGQHVSRGDRPGTPSTSRAGGELVRLIRDLEHHKQAAVNRARMMPWRR